MLVIILSFCVALETIEGLLCKTTLVLSLIKEQGKTTTIFYKSQISEGCKITLFTIATPSSSTSRV